MLSIRSYHTDGIGAEVTLRDGIVQQVHLFTPGYDGKFVILVAEIESQGTGRLSAVRTSGSIAWPNTNSLESRDVGSITVESISENTLHISYAINTEALNPPGLDFSPSIPYPPVMVGTATLGRLA